MSILAKCPGCHQKQKVGNKKCCKCGEDLVKASRLKRVLYYNAFRTPDDNKLHLVRVGTSLKEAKIVDHKRKVQKDEGRIVDMLPDSQTTFEELAVWYLGLARTKKLKAFKSNKSNITNSITKSQK